MCYEGSCKLAQSITVGTQMKNSKRLILIFHLLILLPHNIDANYVFHGMKTLVDATDCRYPKSDSENKV